jgi:hypothetical protein
MKKFTSILQIVLLATVLAVSFHYVLAARPSTLPDDNGIALVSESSTDEFKAGGLKLGDGSTTPPVVTTGYKLDVRGSMFGTGLSVIKSGGTGGNMSVTGTITGGTLTGTSSGNVCADTTGTLTRC